MPVTFKPQHILWLVLYPNPLHLGTQPALLYHYIPATNLHSAPPHLPIPHTFRLQALPCPKPHPAPLRLLPHPDASPPHPLPYLDGSGLFLPTTQGQQAFCACWDGTLLHAVCITILAFTMPCLECHQQAPTPPVDGTYREFPVCRRTADMPYLRHGFWRLPAPLPDGPPDLALHHYSRAAYCYTLLRRTGGRKAEARLLLQDGHYTVDVLPPSADWPAGFITTVWLPAVPFGQIWTAAGHPPPPGAYLPLPPLPPPTGSWLDEDGPTVAGHVVHTSLPYYWDLTPL